MSWGLVSANTNIRWFNQVLWQFAEQLHWQGVSRNPTAFNDLSLLKEFDAFIDWKGEDDCYGVSIASNTGLPWTEEFIQSLEHKICFEKLSTNQSVQWSEAIVDRYKGRWDIVELACNEAVPWTLPLFDRHLDESHFFYFGVLANPSILRNLDLVEKYIHKMEWWAVFSNAKLPWYEQNLLERWHDHIDWYGLSLNELFFRIDKNFFSNHIDKWMENNCQGFSDLSSNCQVPWSRETIEQYLPFWNWSSLCDNASIPWDEEMIAYFGDYVEWGGTKPSGIYNEEGALVAPTGGLVFELGLTTNENLPWSVDFLNRYQSQFNIDELVIVVISGRKLLSPALMIRWLILC